MQHRLPATPDTVLWGYIDPSARPAIWISDGDRVTVETLSGGPRNIPDPDMACNALSTHLEVITNLRPEMGPHILTGPIHIAGADSGDRLVVEIEALEFAQDFGWNAIEPGFGIFPDIADGYENLIIPIDREHRRAKLPWGPEPSLAPFFGVLAVAPDPAMGRVTSIVPGPFGGNIDNPFCRQGARIEFPVFCEGALFMVGDGHALQGDGEVCDTALETALNGRFRFTIEKGTAPSAPELFFGDLVITMDFDEDLNVAAVRATDRMMNHLQRHAGLTRKDAYRHCSLFASLRITQLVNRRKGVHCMLSRDSLSAPAMQS